MKTFKLFIALAFIAITGNITAQGEDANQLPPELATILNGNSTIFFPPVPTLPTQRSNGESSLEKVSTYLVEFNNNLSSAKSLSRSQKTSVQNDYNNILNIAEKDERFLLIKPYIDNATSISQFIQSLETVKPQLLQMNGGSEFYAKMSYSLQLYVNQYQSPPFNPNVNITNSKGGPNSFDLVYEEYTYGCAHSILTGMGAGAAVGSIAPAIGTTAGAIIGGIIGLLDCLDK